MKRDECSMEIIEAHDLVSKVAINYRPIDTKKIVSNGEFLRESASSRLERLIDPLDACTNSIRKLTSSFSLHHSNLLANRPLPARMLETQITRNLVFFLNHKNLIGKKIKTAFLMAVAPSIAEDLIERDLIEEMIFFAEYPVKNSDHRINGRIDILGKLEADDKIFLLVIEAKAGAGLHGEQLKVYDQFINKQKRDAEKSKSFEGRKVLLGMETGGSLKASHPSPNIDGWDRLAWLHFLLRFEKLLNIVKIDNEDPRFLLFRRDLWYSVLN